MLEIWGRRLCSEESEAARCSRSGDVVQLRGDGGDLVAGHSGRQAIVGGQGRRERVRPKGQEIRLQRGYDVDTSRNITVELAKMGRGKFRGGFSPGATPLRAFSCGPQVVTRWAVAAFRWWCSLSCSGPAGGMAPSPRRTCIN